MVQIRAIPEIYLGIAERIRCNPYLIFRWKVVKNLFRKLTDAPFFVY